MHLSYCLHFKEKHGKERYPEGGVIEGKNVHLFLFLLWKVELQLFILKLGTRRRQLFTFMPVLL